MGCSTFDALHLQISLSFFFFSVWRVATLTGEPFRLYFSFSFRLTYVHLLLLVGIIRRFFFPPFLLLFVLRRVYVLLLFLSCLTVLRKERSFFFSPRLSFCCFYGVTPLSWSRHIHTFRTSTTTTKRVIQIGEQELRNTSVGDCGSDVTLTAPAYPRRTEGAEELL